MDGASTSSGVVARLERWERFGGTWTVVVTQGTAVTLSLRRCDGGEEQERIVCANPDLLRWLDGRSGSAG